MNDLSQVHAPDFCAGQVCAIHNPSHHMADLPWSIRFDRCGLVERHCHHGVGHPDPDSVRWLEAHNYDVGGTVHGCCAQRCCLPSPLLDHVVQAIRINDWGHSKGVREIAEITLAATAEYFRQKADSAPNATSRTLRLLIADNVDPEVASVDT